MTPLHLACEAGHEQVVQSLLAIMEREAAAGIAATRPSVDSCRTPHFLARRNGHEGVVNLLDGFASKPSGVQGEACKAGVT